MKSYHFPSTFADLDYYYIILVGNPLLTDPQSSPPVKNPRPFTLSLNHFNGSAEIYPLIAPIPKLREGDRSRPHSHHSYVSANQNPPFHSLAAPHHSTWKSPNQNQPFHSTWTGHQPIRSLPFPFSLFFYLLSTREASPVIDQLLSTLLHSYSLALLSLRRKHVC